MVEQGEGRDFSYDFTVSLNWIYYYFNLYLGFRTVGHRECVALCMFVFKWTGLFLGIDILGAQNILTVKRDTVGQNKKDNN